MKKIYFIELLIVILFSLLLSCAEENPDLVNPPPQSESVRVRLINFDQGDGVWKLVLDGQVETEYTQWGNASTAMRPPGDSSKVKLIEQSSGKEFNASRKLRFTRNNFYTVFAMSASFTYVDTIVKVGTLAGLIKKDDISQIRLYNAHPDTNRTYSMVRGCQNGERLASNIPFLKVSPQREVRSDGVPITLLRNIDGKSEFVNLYNLDLEEYKQYMLIVAKNKNDEETIYLLDEFNEYSDALRSDIEVNTELNTHIKIINTSESDVIISKYPGNIELGDLLPQYISEFREIATCNSESLDTIYASINSNTMSSIKASFDVSEEYSILVFDSAEKKCNLLMIAEPYRMDDEGKAIVRVVHASSSMPQITISIAARDDQNNSLLGYSSGELIASKLNYSNISEPILVRPGENIPITLFSTSEPAQLLYTAIADIEAGKKYLLLVTYDESEKKDKLYLVEDNEIDKSLTPLPEGIFIQVINLIPGLSDIDLSLGAILNKVKMNYGASLATVISAGNQNLSVNESNLSIEAEINERIIVIAAGSKSNIELLLYQYPDTFSVSSNYYKRRFLNASKNTGFLSIKENDIEEPFIEERIQFGKVTKMRTKTLKRNLSLFFIDSELNKVLFQIDDLPFPFGKNYTIIFGGSASDKSYSVVVLQEF